VTVVSCWSVKGGSGTTVVAAALAGTASRVDDRGVVFVDLAGDGLAALGGPSASGPGIRDWLAGSDGAEGLGDGLDGDAPATFEVRLSDRLAVLPRGGSGVADDARRVPELLTRLAADGRVVICDCGTLTRSDAVACAVAAASPHSLLVTRCCYLALRRTPDAPVRPSGIVVISEPGRALGSADVAEVVGAPVLAEVPLDARLARTVDAGVLLGRLSRSTQRALTDLVPR
jgi:cellulose biosynthesis protein BcsQ